MLTSMCWMNPPSPLESTDHHILHGTLLDHIKHQELHLRDESGRLLTLSLGSLRTARAGTKLQYEIDLSQIPVQTRLKVEVKGQQVIRLEVVYPWHERPAQWIDECIDDFTHVWGKESDVLGNKTIVTAILGMFLVSLICGVVSSLVVSNRMAFFSDALAHCAFAGVAIGSIMSLLTNVVHDDFIIYVMMLFGVIFGLAIAYVREQTTLANDTVIGVFFAGSMGLGAILLTALSRLGSRINPENFLFGDPLNLRGQEIMLLLMVLLFTALFMAVRYNRMVFASFNPSLARSRQIRVKLGYYLFIVLLAIVVNICLKVVGALLINALLILPAATAGNLARNLRQFFWYSVTISFGIGLGGLMLSVYWVPTINSRPIHLVSGGVIVVLGVLLFFISVLTGRWFRGLRPTVRSAY